ncbi:MAG: DUF3035 domain-containing protein [Alphaproteobacteria bacterium]|nr:DUF3035 domain-containing protein [Alphaproteobacteria bacterium]
MRYFKNTTLLTRSITLCFPLVMGMVGGCDQARTALGYDRKNPDAYKVVDRAPLCMPPDFALRPPKLGAPRPQEKSPQELAQEALLDETSSTEKTPIPVSSMTTSEGEKHLLSQVGEGDHTVRHKLETEHTRSKGRKLPPLAKKLGLKELDDDSVIDPVEEAKKLPSKKIPEQQ